MGENLESTVPVSARIAKRKAAALAELAKMNGRDVGEQIDFLISEALFEAGLLSEEEKNIHRHREMLIQDFLAMAVGIIEAEGHRDDITAETGRRVMQDPSWKARYDEYLSVRDAATINPTFARRVKLRLKLRTGKVHVIPQPAIFSTASYLHPTEPAL